MLTPFAKARSRLGLGTAIAALLAATLSSVPAFADRPEPEATDIQVTGIFDPDVSLPNTPGAEGLVYVVSGDQFTVQVQFVDDNGDPAPLSNNKDETATLTVPDGAGTAEASDTVLAGETFASFEVTVGNAANAVVLTVAAPGAKHTTLSVTSEPFDVLLESLSFTAGTALSQIGGTNTDEGCVASPADPVCADLLLPRGSSGEAIYLSLGVCAGLTECSGSYVQALANVTGYSTVTPATLIMKCDKTLCGGGAIKSNNLIVDLVSGVEPGPAPAPECPAKGTVGTDQKFCVDYVQSTRDNAGDTHLYLLFTEDAKVRFP